MRLREAHSAIRAIMVAAGNALDQIDLALRSGDVDGIESGADLMGRIIEDYIYVIAGTEFEGESRAQSLLGARKPRIPCDTPDAMIEYLRDAIAVDTQFLKDYLKGWPGITDEEEDRNRERADTIMEALGNLARQVRREIQERWPYCWTDKFEKELAQYLRMRRPSR